MQLLTSNRTTWTLYMLEKNPLDYALENGQKRFFLPRIYFDVSILRKYQYMIFWLLSSIVSAVSWLSPHTVSCKATMHVNGQKNILISSRSEEWKKVWRMGIPLFCLHNIASILLGACFCFCMPVFSDHSDWWCKENSNYKSQVYCYRIFIV